MQKCIKCGSVISSDEAGLYRKLVNRGATQFMCINCLASHFKLSVEELRELIERFRAMGCTLFAKKSD